jgi:hypothetical protein
MVTGWVFSFQWDFSGLRPLPLLVPLDCGLTTPAYI